MLSSTQVNDMNEYCFAILYNLKTNYVDTFFIRSLKQVMVQKLTVVMQRLTVVMQRSGLATRLSCNAKFEKSSSISEVNSTN